MGEQPQGNGTQPARNDASNLRAEDAQECTVSAERVRERFHASEGRRFRGYSFRFLGSLAQADKIDFLANDSDSLDANDMELTGSVEAESAFEESRRSCHFHAVHEDRHYCSEIPTKAKCLPSGSKGESRDVTTPRTGFAIDYDAAVISVFRDERKSGTVRGEDKALLDHGQSGHACSQRMQSVAVGTPDRYTNCDKLGNRLFVFYKPT